MMSKLASQDDEQDNNLTLKYIKARERADENFFMISIIITRETIRIDIDPTVGIEEFHLVVRYNVDKRT